MLTIHLHKLQFHAHHGLYELEKFSGNTFEIDVDVDVAIHGQVTKLTQTVNYATVYEVIKLRMKDPTPLLETLAQDLTTLIHDIDEKIIAVNISLKKLSPPIENFQGVVGVSFKTIF